MGSNTNPPSNTVKIYVRMDGDRDEARRRISFRIPSDGRLDALDLLDRGLAIDGNEAVFDVGPEYEEARGLTLYYGPWDDEPGSSLAEGLMLQQKALVTFLREKGYTPQFA